MESTRAFVLRFFNLMTKFITGASLILWFSAACIADSNIEAGKALDRAEQDCRQGYYHIAIEPLKNSYDAATDPILKARAAAALSRAYLRTNNTDLGAEYLAKAIAQTTEPLTHAKLLVERGNIFAGQKRWTDADESYTQALNNAPPGDILVRKSVTINRLRNLQGSQRLDALTDVANTIPGSLSERDQVRFLLNIGYQALEMQPEGKQLAFQSFSRASSIATDIGEGGNEFLAESYDGLSDLYERDRQHQEARYYVEKALHNVSAVSSPQLLIGLEWRLARLLKTQGDEGLAIAAYRRAVQQIESVRSEIPITYQNGQSSFRETLEPIYLGLTDLLFKQATTVDGQRREQLLREAITTVELVKQTELQDYLRDRCSVGTSSSDKKLSIPPGTAIFYPVILPDRLELIIETASGIDQQSVSVMRNDLQNTALEFTKALRLQSKKFDVPGRKLHGWLFKPIEAMLIAKGITSIVVVPDGVLRLVPFGAILDGDQFLVERYAISTSPGLSAMRSAPISRSRGQFLLAGLSKPGNVVEKLPSEIIDALLSTSSQRSLIPSRAITRGEGESRTLQGKDEVSDSDNLRELLTLEGVKKEIDDIRAMVSVETPLMDESFTLRSLERDIAGRSFRIIHIASHGFFGDNAQNSFILTFDELLRLDKLKSLLRTRTDGSAIDLITLSACQTAEGDDRAPLGFSGVAIKAGAKSAIGTLWPVADDAATILMPQFYKNLIRGKLSKRDALRMAQLEFVREGKLKKQFGHPFFWAPFILVGDWQ